jgi:hypothetical protein
MSEHFHTAPLTNSGNKAAVPWITSTLALREGSIAAADSSLSPLIVPGYPYITAALKSLAQERAEGIHRLSELNAYFHLPTGAWEGYTVIRHTDLVLAQATKYPLVDRSQAAETKCPYGLIGLKDFTALLLFHDLNKLPEIINGTEVELSKEAQHQRSSQLLIDFSELLGIDKETLRIILKVLETEVLGKVISKVHPWRPSPEEKRRVRETLLELAVTEPAQAFSLYQKSIDSWQETAAQSAISNSNRALILSAAKSQIITAASDVGVNPKEFLFYLTAYFQRDVSAYAYDAVSLDEHGAEYRAFPATDLLFERKRDVSSLSEPLFIYDQQLFSFCPESRIFCKF